MTIHPKDSDITIPSNARRSRVTSVDDDPEMTLSWLQIQAMSNQPSNIQPQPIPQFLVSSSPNPERIALPVPTGIRRQNVRMCRVPHLLTVHRRSGKRALCDILEEALSISSEIMDLASEPALSSCGDKSNSKDLITNTNDLNAEDLSATTLSNTK